MPTRCKFAQRLAFAFALILALVASPSAARAEAVDIAVLPMTTAAKSLRLYRTAAPSALAAQLAKRGMSVRAITSASDVSKSVRVIIDGRLVARGKDKLQIELQVRRGSTGRPIATVASPIASATDIDRLVGQLAGSLKPLLDKALVAEPFVLPTTVVRGAAPENREGLTAPAPGFSAKPPAILLLPATGQAAGGMVEVREPATQAAAHMLHRVGLTAGQSSKGEADVASVVAEMRARKIPHSLMVQVVSVKYSYANVLSARGRVRIVLVAQDGLAALDKTVSTDTVVGGRGDRHQALVYRVVEQAFDIVQPSLSRVLAGSAGDDAS